MQRIDLGLLQRGSTHCTTMGQSNLQAQLQIIPTGHMIHRVTALPKKMQASTSEVLHDAHDVHLFGEGDSGFQSFEALLPGIFEEPRSSDLLGAFSSLKRGDTLPTAHDFSATAFACVTRCPWSMCPSRELVPCSTGVETGQSARAPYCYSTQT